MKAHTKTPVTLMERVLLCVVILLLSQACSLVPKKKKSSDKDGAGVKLVIRDPIYFDRTGDGDVARLSFSTKRPAVCEMSVYAQDPGVQPTRDAPMVVPCAEQTKGRTEFVEKIEGLRTDSLYHVDLRAWDFGKTSADAETVPIIETTEKTAVINPGTDPGDGGKFKDLIVARMNLPLKTAEVHHSELPDALDLQAIKAKLTRTVGCQAGVPDKVGPFRDAAKDIVIKNLATKDLGAGTAAPHKDYPERLSLTYASLNDSVERWTFTYAVNSKDIMLAARPISRIVNMEMESTSVQAFDAPQLAETTDPLRLDTSKPLKLSWTTGNNLLDLSYLTVQIGRPENDKSIYCVFPASVRSATIDAKLLQGLDDGKYVILAELATNQLFAKEGWLVSVYDWRSGRIEK